MIPNTAPESARAAGPVLKETFWVDLPGLRFPEDEVCTGGRPEAHHLYQAKAAGVRTVVDLCAPGERYAFDEAALAAELGMRYVNLPVRGPADLNQVQAERLAGILADCAQRPVMIHCGSGNRAGALFALKAYWVDGLSAERSIAAGRAAGLTTLEPEVRCILAGR